MPYPVWSVIVGQQFVDIPSDNVHKS